MNLDKKIVLRVVTAILFALNTACVLFLAVSPAVSGGSSASHVFAVILTLILISDIAYAAVIMRKWGAFQLINIAVSLLLAYLLNLITSTVTPAFPVSISIVGLIFTIWIFASSAVLNALDFFSVKDAPVKRVKAYRKFLIASSAVAVAFILGMTVLASTFISVSGNMILSSLAFPLAFMVMCFGALFTRLTLRDLNETTTALTVKKQWAGLAAVAVLSVFSALVFLMPTFAVGGDIAKTEQSYNNAFGDYSRYENADMRKTPFSLADVYTAIPTANYSAVYNVPYIVSDLKGHEGLTLAFDVYTPKDKTDVPVIVFFHGYGVDKHEVVGRLRYLATQGYAVYSVQYGTPGENTIEGPRLHGADFERCVYYASEFLKFAKQPENNPYGADWSRVFVMGNSYGGALASTIGLMPGNGDKYDSGLTYKGIIAIYPAIVPYTISDSKNPYNQVNENSAPMLMFMGSNDGVVYNLTPLYIEDAYKSKCGGKFARIYGDFMTHAGDYILGGAGNQLTLYYSERFLAQFSNA